MTDIDATVIKRTQDTLGKYVKKPPLAEKLLKKPPFRFIMDVFNAVIKDTGCFEGLYTADELNYENIKDRDDKIRFLQKMIDVIKLVTGSQLSVRPSKIVAGHEPEKTNELLQLLAQVVEKQLPWQSAVQKVVGGKTDAPQEVAKSKPNDKPKDAKAKEKPKENGVKPKESKTKESRDAAKNPAGGAVTKSKQSTVSKEKEKDKVSSRKTKEKPSKETKETDKNGRKLKETKARPTNQQSSSTKTERRASLAKTSSQETNDSLPANRSDTSNGAPESMPNKLETVVEAPPAKTPTQTSTAPPAKLERQNTKTMDEFSLNTIGNGVSSPKQPMEQQNSIVESRKSSAQRRSSGSGKSQRASNGRSQPDEQVDTKSLQNNEDSLKMLVEESAPQPPVKEVPVAPPKPITPPPARQPSVSSNNGSSNMELRREPTMTREMSRDSNDGRPRTSLRPPSARPPSARPGAPRRRDRNVEIILQPNEPVKVAGINVKLEPFGDLDDDGENLVIIEDPNAEKLTHAMGEELVGEQNVENSQLEHQGHLVQQILKTQKELVQQNGEDESKTDKSGLAGVRQTSARHMNSLRDVIQNLTKSVHPFGALLDFIPEDIDAMQLELSMWRDSYESAASELRREKSLTETAIEPLKQQLEQIEANIKEYAEMIDASRNKIIANSEKILKMLTE